MGTESVNGSAPIRICSTWGMEGRSKIKKTQKKFNRSCVIAPGTARHPKGAAKENKSLLQKKISTRNPDKLLKKAVKNFEKALKSAKKEASRKGVTPESMRATLAKHALNLREVKDIFYNMPPGLLDRPAVKQAFQQILAAEKPMPIQPSGPPAADHQPKEPLSTFGKITPRRAAPDVFIAELNKQKQDEFGDMDGIDQLCDYMKQLKEQGASSKLLLELAKSFPNYQAVGWDVHQFMELCYEAHLAIYEGRTADPASAMDKAYRKMSGSGPDTDEASS